MILLDLLVRPAIGDFSPSEATLHVALDRIHNRRHPDQAGSSWDHQEPFILATIGSIAAGQELPLESASLKNKYDGSYQDGLPKMSQAAALKYLLKNKEFKILAEVMDIWEATPQGHKITGDLLSSCEGVGVSLRTQSLTSFELNQLVRFLKNIFMGVPEDAMPEIRWTKGYKEPLDLTGILPPQSAQEMFLEILREIKPENAHYDLISKSVFEKLLKLISSVNLLGSAKTEEFLDLAASGINRLIFTERRDWSTGEMGMGRFEKLMINGEPFTCVFSNFLKNSWLSAEERVTKLIDLVSFQGVDTFHFLMQHWSHDLPAAYESLKEISGTINDISFDSLYFRDFHNDDAYRKKIERSSHVLLDYIARKKRLDNLDLELIGSVLRFDANLANEFCFFNQLSKKAFNIYLDKCPEKLVSKLNSSKPSDYLPLLALITMHDPVLSDRLFSLQGIHATLKGCLAWGVPKKSTNDSQANEVKEWFFASEDIYTSITKEAPHEIKFLAPWLYKQGVTQLSSISLEAFSDQDLRLSLSNALYEKKINLAGIIKILDYASGREESDLFYYSRELEKIQTGEIESLLPFRLSPWGLGKVISNRENPPKEGAITAVVLQAPSDHNGALHQMEHRFPQFFKDDVHTLFFNPKDIGSLGEILDRLKSDRPEGVDILSVAHHGNQLSCQWGKDSGFSVFLATFLASNFIKCKHLIINSCSAFKGGGDGINLANAYAAGIQLNRRDGLTDPSTTIYGPTEPAALGAEIFSLENGLNIKTEGPCLFKEIPNLPSGMSLDFVRAKLFWLVGRLRATIS